MRQDAKTPKKRHLPRSGMAEEILKIDGQSSTPEDSRELVAVASQTAPGFDQPERIYKFAESLQQNQQVEKPRAQTEKLEPWIQFILQNEAFGLPVSNIQEILRVGYVTRIPYAPKAVRGITNMRGRILTVIDLRRRLGLPESQIDDRSRILVASSQDQLMGLLVDSVQQVTQFSRSTILPPPTDIMTPQSDYIIGVHQHQNGIVILLDVDRVVTIQKDPDPSPSNKNKNVRGK